MVHPLPSNRRWRRHRHPGQRLRTMSQGQWSSGQRTSRRTRTSCCLLCRQPWIHPVKRSFGIALQRSRESTPKPRPRSLKWVQEASCGWQGSQRRPTNIGFHQPLCRSHASPRGLRNGMGLCYPTRCWGDSLLQWKQSVQKLGRNYGRWFYSPCTVAKWSSHIALRAATEPEEQQRWSGPWWWVKPSRRPRTG